MAAPSSWGLTELGKTQGDSRKTPGNSRNTRKNHGTNVGGHVIHVIKQNKVSKWCIAQAISYLSYFPAAAYVGLIEHIYLNDLIDATTSLTRLRSKVFNLFVFKL